MPPAHVHDRRPLKSARVEVGVSKRRSNNALGHGRSDGYYSGSIGQLSVQPTGSCRARIIDEIAALPVARQDARISTRTPLYLFHHRSHCDLKLSSSIDLSACLRAPRAVVSVDNMAEADVEHKQDCKPAQYASEDSSGYSSDVQEGVKAIEATARVWTTKSLYIAYAGCVHMFPTRSPSY